MNKDKAEGLLYEAKGRKNALTDKLVGDETLELKGKVQNSAGKVQAAVGDLKEDLEKASNKR